MEYWVSLQFQYNKFHHKILSYFDNSDLEDYQSEEDEENAEYQFALAVTANIMTIEVIHRLIVVCYEVWFTMQGGATPGKRTMGIRIITCTRSEPIGTSK